MPPTMNPSKDPTIIPSSILSNLTSRPSTAPSNFPSAMNTQNTTVPTTVPSISVSPSAKATMQPSSIPSMLPSRLPSSGPTLSALPTLSLYPSSSPSDTPSTPPSISSMPTSEWKLDAWRQVGQDILGTRIGDETSSSIALSKDASCVAIGSPFNDEVAENTGLVRVFRRSIDNKWEPLGETLYGEGTKSRFGTSLDVSDSCQTLAIGSILKRNTAGIRTGRVTVFRLYGDQWTKLGNGIDGNNLFDDMGRSVSLSSDGNIVAVAAPKYASRSGLVRVFEYSNVTGIFGQLGQDLLGNETGDLFGHDISISSLGSIMAVSSLGSSSLGLTKNGRVEVFKLVDAKWVGVGQALVGSASMDQFGVSVSLSDSGDTVAAGSPYHRDSAGLVRVFRLYNDTWTQLGYDIIGANAGTLSGSSTSISADGGVVAVSGFASIEQDSTSGAGQILVYKLSNDTWVKAGDVYTGDMSTDLFRRPVSLSADGEGLAISGPSGNGVGVVKVYEHFDMQYPSSAPTPTPSLRPTGSARPTIFLSHFPSESTSPTLAASSYPSVVPTSHPTGSPSDMPSTSSPTKSNRPTQQKMPSPMPSKDATIIPSSTASRDPSALPFSRPSKYPSLSPTAIVYPSSIHPTSSTNTTHFPTPSPTLKNQLWRQISDIRGEPVDDLFGSSIAISSDGQTVAIGAPSDDNSNGKNSGNVNIFRLVNGSFEKLGNTMTLNGGKGGDYFGVSLALSGNGNTVVVGANEFNGREGPLSGLAIVYNLSSNNLWVMKGSAIEGEAGGDKTGTSVDISDNGDIVAIGAYLNDNQNGDSAGRVRVFTYDFVKDSWSQLGNALNGESTSEGFGAALSISGSGTTISVGGPFSNSYYEGNVRVFRLSVNKEWIQVGDSIDGISRNGNFGDQVSLSFDGNVVGVGMLGDSSQVRIFMLENNSWTMLGQEIPGCSIALSQDGFTAVIGNPTTNAYGNVRIFKFDGSNWAQVGENITGTQTNMAGNTVAISGNGAIVATGSISGSGGNVKIYHNTASGSIDSNLRFGGEPYFPSYATSASSIWKLHLATSVVIFTIIPYFII